MRVVHLAGYGGEYAGSFIPMLLAIGREAQARGWSAETIFQADAEGRGWVQELRHAGVPVSFGPAAGGREDLARWLSEHLDGDRQPVVLHTHFTTFDLPAVSAARGRGDTPVIWHMHSPLGRSAGQWLRNAAKFATAGHRVERLLAVAPDVATQLKARLAPRSRVQYFPNAIDCARFSLASADDRRRAREQLGLPVEGVVLVHFGWDWERKAGDLFVEAVAELRSRGVEAVGATVGGGAEARAAAERSGVADAVVALPPTDAVGDTYAAADAFVSCSRAEGMPFAVLEAIARGAPVVATDLPGHAEVASRLAACRLAAATPAALADAVEESLARPRAEREESRATMERELDVRPWARRLADLYEQITPRT